MNLADQTIIVLGSDGFVGRHLVRFIAQRGGTAHGIGHSAGDLTKPELVDAAFAAAPKATRIMHAVTKQRTGAIQYKMQGELLADNARIHLNVLEAWRRYQPEAKLISLGSSCVYPESDAILPESAFCTGTPHPSVRGYALAKEVLAEGCELYGQQYGLTWLHCVLATIYGPNAHTEEHRSHFMAAMIDRAARTKAGGADSFEVWGNPDTVRDLLYIDDQLEAVFAADAVFENRIINVTSNAPVTVGNCAHAILQALDWLARIIHPPGTFQGAHFKSLDSSIFLQATGWRPLVPLADGVRRVLAANYIGGCLS
jgi:nucleoside-diphosphate-sugar epimerase